MSASNKLEGNTKDFWRDSTGGIPDGVSDHTQMITHNGALAYGSQFNHPNRVVEYLGVVKYRRAVSSTNVYRVNTKIPYKSGGHYLLRFRGLTYTPRTTVVDWVVNFYTYDVSGLIAVGATVLGSEPFTSVRVGRNQADDTVAIEITPVSTQYFTDFTIDVHVNGPLAQEIDYMSGWEVNEDVFDATVLGVVNATKYGVGYPFKQDITIISATGFNTAVGVDGLGLSVKANTLGIMDTRNIDSPPSAYPPGVTVELKIANTVGVGNEYGKFGLPVGTFGTLITTRPYVNLGGGVVTQRLQVSQITGIRVLVRNQNSVSDTWGGWLVSAESNGNLLPQYTSPAAAAADATLTSGSVYHHTPDGTIRIKP